MTSIQRKRLIRYANFLNRLPSKHFNLNIICKAGKNPLFELQDQENSCGTTACAMGHLPVFNRRVFEFVDNNGDSRWGNLEVKFKDDNSLLNFDAACYYFGITKDQAVMLFEPKRYNKQDWHNPKAVAERILVDILGLLRK